MRDYIRINKEDNVVVALKDLKKSSTLKIDKFEVVLKEDVLRGHKIAIKNINKGENIIKYGQPIGHAINNIDRGEWIHTHNIKTNLDGILDYTYSPLDVNINIPKDKLTFKGYKREDGNIGIRNELWIIPTVGCVNGIGEKILNEFICKANPQNLDGIQIFKHNYGCSQLGEDHANTQAILSDMVSHPNAGGVLILGLGCENNNIQVFSKKLGKYDHKRVRFLQAQEVEDEISEGVNLLKELYENMQKDKREQVPLSKLKVGLKCGGSDGLSGITANPLIGKFSDFIIAQGGTTILTEVPEMFGAETILMNRCINKDVFNRTVRLVNDFKNYFLKYNQPIYENPSPGNKKGGITTLEDKSLGCIQKGGIAPVVDVLKYGERIKANGLNLLSSPGNDLVATTALAASGCQMVLFSTGRGTPFGSFVPTIKICSNSELYIKKPNWIDFNAGNLLNEDIEDELELFIKFIIRVASGKFVNNEKNKFKEISIFKTGVTL